MTKIILEKLAYTRNLCIDAINSCRHDSGMSIHSRIKERRIELGLKSHHALAEIIGVSWQTVQLWEKEGGTAPNRKRIDAVAAALGVTVEWLRSGDDSVSSNPYQAKFAEQGTDDLGDAAKLLMLFSQSTHEGRKHIMDSALAAEKINVTRNAASNDQS